MPIANPFKVSPDLGIRSNSSTTSLTDGVRAFAEEHLFADSSLDAYDPDAAALLLGRVRSFLASV